jgi:hypothetical protein
MPTGRDAMSKHWRLWLGVALATCVGVALLAFSLRRPAPPGSGSSENLAIQVAREYVAANESWPESDYTVEDTHTQDNDGNLVISIIHKDDLKGLTPGGGKSVELHIDLGKRRVVKVLHFQ